MSVLDIALINRCLGDSEGFVYSPPDEGAEFGTLYANDSLLVFVYLHEDHAQLVVPVMFCDELDSEDFRTEVTDDAEFYQEEAARFSYFLEANRCAGASRGMSLSLHEESNAISLNCKGYYSVLTEHSVRGLVHSLLRVAVALRMELFPDEVDPELAQLPDYRAETGRPPAERPPGAAYGWHLDMFV